MNQWVANWGDGLVYGAEVWDDANSVSGDGCASDWTTIEDRWTWVNGSTTHKSDWSIWDAGYEPNSTKTHWDIASTPSDITALIILTLFTTLINASFSLISSIKSQSSIQSTFSGLNQLQLILLLPLIGAFVPTKVVQFIAGLNILLTYLQILTYQT